jgi:hypothetical protein
MEVSVGKAGKKRKLAGNVRWEKIGEGGNPDIRNWQCRGLIWSHAHTFPKLDASKKKFFGMCIVKMIPFTPRSKVQNEVSPPFVFFFLLAFDSDTSSMVALCTQEIGRYSPDKWSMPPG